MSIPISPPAPLPANCLNGGVLGYGRDTRLMLVTRGATQLITELFPTGGTFTRELHNTSTLQTEAVIGGRPDTPQPKGWEKVIPWATELMVMRDGRDAWGGPVTEALFSVGKVTAGASDLSAWHDRRRTIAAKYVDMDPVDIFVALHDAAMAVDPVDNFMVAATPSGIKTDREYLAADQAYVADDLRELGDTWVDWTVYSRTLIVGDTELQPDSYLLLSDDMWSQPPQVKIRGNEQATVVIVKGADGIVAVATAPPEYLAYYGRLERVFEESSIKDQASLDVNAQTRLDALKDPVYIETPTNATLLPTAPISFESLIPGIRVRVQAMATARQVVADFRLAKVTASFDGKVSVDLQPIGTVS